MNIQICLRSRGLFIRAVTTITFLTLLFSSRHACAQGDCGCMPWYKVANPDSLILDTCGLQGEWATCEEAATYAKGSHIYARRWWFVQFDVDAVHLPAVGRDSILEIGWRDIDTAYPDIRAGFEALEAMFGPITLRKLYPDVTTGENSRMFRMRLQRYYRSDSVTTLTDSLPHVYCEFASGILIPSSVTAPESKVIRASLEIRPNPAKDRIRVCFNRRASQATLTITDIAGHRIPASDASAEADGCVSLDVSSLAPGLYLVGSGTDHGTFVVVR